MSLTASAIRRDVDKFATSDKEVSDALLTALAKLVVGPNSDDQVATTTDASAALLGKYLIRMLSSPVPFDHLI
jgi:hypothetical protein